mmetsp:Transcript_69324/g.202962  ORF Transcript_69324/g.202962 Transcript_69324/m.202962 type:complete len:217 (+) Transcript_69324:774-1424(+)
MPWCRMSQTLWSLSAMRTNFAFSGSAFAPRSCTSFLVIGRSESSSVRLATRVATSAPKADRSSAVVVAVSSSVSCSSAACRVGTSRTPSSSRMRDTARGWLMYGVRCGSFRVWPWCFVAAKTMVRRSLSSGCSSVASLEGSTRGGCGSGAEGSPPRAASSTRFTWPQPTSDGASGSSTSKTSPSSPLLWASRAEPPHVEVTRGSGPPFATCAKKST